jgi:hypothetical protein
MTLLSDLIAELTALRAEHGDLPVYVADYHGHQPITHLHTEYHPEPWDHEVVAVIDTREEEDE